MEAPCGRLTRKHEVSGDPLSLGSADGGRKRNHPALRSATSRAAHPEARTKLNLPNPSQGPAHLPYPALRANDRRSQFFR